MVFALSTSWNAYRAKNGAEMLFEIKQLGFAAVELSFNLSSRMLEEAAGAARELGMKVGSVHNYCPIPKGLTPQQALPDFYSLSSLDEKERGLAVKYSKSSIDTACRLGAGAVVLHCGRVEMPDSTRRLIDLYDQGLKGGEEFSNLKREMTFRRAEQAGLYLKQIFSSLEELDSYAEKKGILLGVETRFYHREIPNISEVGLILDKFRGSQIRYWHDTGHAQVMENLGFGSHLDFLKLYGDRLLGIHIHDVKGCRDHLAPSTGSLDFLSLKPYLNTGVLRVIEAHHPASAAELVKSREFLSGILD